MPRKKVIKKSLDPVEVKVENEKPEGNVEEGGEEGKIAPKTYNGIEIIRFIAENSTAYHIQLANGTSTWVNKEAIDKYGISNL